MFYFKFDNNVVQYVSLKTFGQDSCNECYVFILVRGVLGMCSLASFRLFRRGVCRKFGPSVSNFLSIITMTQFHLIFYMSRSLPNIFALILGMVDINTAFLTAYDMNFFIP